MDAGHLARGTSGLFIYFIFFTIHGAAIAAVWTAAPEDTGEATATTIIIIVAVVVIVVVVEESDA